jgi:hydroxymethylpyrimidine pyrophosphatase-like HAD family hydrolase
MQPLPMPEKITGVLSFDFDGTLVCPDSDPRLDPRFFEVIQQFREQGIMWGVNTGRSQMQMLSGFMEGKFPFLPDFLIARERELYTPGKLNRWIPVAEWNKRSDKDHKKVYRRARKFISQVREHVESQTSAIWITEEGDPAGIVASSVEEMAGILEFIDGQIGNHRDLAYLRNTIYLRFSHKDYHKGTSLAEIARRCGVGAEKVFAIGDGHNDIDMLHRDYAHMIACPANADEEVKQHVREQGGYLCKERASLGAIEAMRHFLAESHLG